MANDHDEILQLYKDPMKAFAHQYLWDLNDDVERIGRQWQKMKRQRKAHKPLNKALSFALTGILELLWSERFEEYSWMFEQDPSRMRKRLIEKLAGDEKTCPKCGDVGRAGEKFGYRRVGDKTYVQPWCRQCRSG